jgi:hypothetical protein
MSADSRLAPPDLVAVLLTVAFAAACTAFVWQPSLASFADDSVSYLVMAQVFSPWQPAAQPVAEAFVREAFYPPLFPLVLALAGGAHDMAIAHAITALLLAACLTALYVLGGRWLGSKWAAAAAVAVTALLPSLWIHVKGILSEPLFCLLLVAILIVLEAGKDDRRRPWALAALMAAMVLTRTVGLVVVAAYALWAVSRRDRPLSVRAQALLPALFAAFAYAAWVLMRPAETADDYMRIVFERGQAIFAADNPWAALGYSFLRQANSLAEAWVGALLLFWVEGRPLRVVLAGVVGALAAAGIALRLAAGKPDAWMTAAYLATFLVWPFYDQMTRFLFPVLPVLVLNAFWAGHTALRALGRPPVLAHGLLVLLLLSLAVPAMGFIHQRAKTGGRYVEMTDWYRTPDLDNARMRAQIHLDLVEEMETIRRLTEPGDSVMWVAPSYIALLADRRGVPAPQANLPPADYRRTVYNANPDYLYLSTYHPRDTVRDVAWRTGMEAMAGHAEAIHSRKPGDGGAIGSALLKIKRASRVGLLTVRGGTGDGHGTH